MYISSCMRYCLKGVKHVRTDKALQIVSVQGVVYNLCWMVYKKQERG